MFFVEFPGEFLQRRHNRNGFCARCGVLGIRRTRQRESEGLCREWRQSSHPLEMNQNSKLLFGRKSRKPVDDTLCDARDSPPCRFLAWIRGVCEAHREDMITVD